VNHADWRTTTDAGEFLAQAGLYLEGDPVENTLLLTIAHGVLGSSSASAPAPDQAVPLYATSQAARAAGAREVVLFTDLANPTSNALYQRLGYRPVSDRLVLSFTA
jgi:hypothetical protein